MASKRLEDTPITEKQQSALDAVQEHGGIRAAARALGENYSSFNRKYHTAKKKEALDPFVAGRLAELGVKDLGGAHSAWLELQGADGKKAGNLYVQFPKDEPKAFTEVVTESLEAYKPLDRKLFAPRVNVGAKGDKLLVVDLADVHFGKLCVKEETNHTYNVEVARHRVVEGTRALLREASGVARILFVMGNDILHTDNGKTSTAGTPQDSDGSYFTAWRAAQHASIDAIGECASVADVDLIHCMSNHDWRSGWALSQTIAAAISGHEGVRATPYNMSETHRKYYGYGQNAFQIHHADGAKEEKLYALFVSEARALISKCNYLYSICHHFHHKMSKRRGTEVTMSEKDHTGLTAITIGGAMHNKTNETTLAIEYVRSPSPPDGWHDRNGYVNRQAVEAFIHCPHDGQKQRLTEWF